MSRFYVGQRVRIVRNSVGCRGGGSVQTTITNSIGRTGVIAGTLSHPNAGFSPSGDYDVSLRLDTGELGMAPSICLEPITDSYDKVEWSECLWRPTQGEVTA